MRQKFRGLIAYILIIITVTGSFPFVSNGSSDVYYIKNSYTKDAYLYEAEGILQYGIPTSKDMNFQWRLETVEERTYIKNLGTGNYITLEGHGGDFFEGSFSDPIACLPLEQNNDRFQWHVEGLKGRNIISLSQDYTEYALHLEGTSNGKVRAQHLQSDQLAWGNMQWDFIGQDEITIEAIAGGVCIQNVDNDSYLSVNNHQVLTYGNPDGPDDAYIWFIEEEEDGSKALRNKKTNLYITMEGYNSTNKSLTLGAYKDNAGNRWHFQIGTEVQIVSTAPAYSNYGLQIERVSSGRVSAVSLSTDEALASRKWNIKPAHEVEEISGPLTLNNRVVSLKNSWFSMYLIEDNEKIVYGNINPSKKSAQWRLIFNEESQRTALKNEETSNYIYWDEDKKELISKKEPVYAWNLKRSMNTDYPSAIVLQLADYPERYFHMENLTGFIEVSNGVQPSWGTPHWDIVEVYETPDETTYFIVPEEYIRLRSPAMADAFLYQNDAGAVVYGEVKEDDPRSHWIFEISENGKYYLKNRAYEDIIVNQGNGSLRCIPKEQLSNDGGLWEVIGGTDKQQLLIRNAYSELPEYLQPYLNIKKLTGLATSNLVSIEDQTSIWEYAIAPEVVTMEVEKTEITVPLAPIEDTNQYHITNQVDLDSTYRLTYYGNQVMVQDYKTNQYIYYQDGLKTKNQKNWDNSILWRYEEKTDKIFLIHAEVTLELSKIKLMATYNEKDSFIKNNQRIFTIYAPEKQLYNIDVKAKKGLGETALYLNGLYIDNYILPRADAIVLLLNKGMNTISFEKTEGIEAITIQDSLHRNYRGATTAYVTYEAEFMETNGTLIEDNRAYREVSSEASNRSGVILERTGQYVKFTLTEPANTILVRYSIPDSEDGVGLDATLNVYADGQKIHSLSMTSQYSWVYGNYPWTNNPSDQLAHHFFDETRFILDKTYPAGTVLKLQKDAANLAKYYVIDCIDMEEIDAANLQPDNSLNIMDYGAIPNDGVDDTRAFIRCLQDAIELGKEVWIPAGTFDINQPQEKYGASDKSNNNRGFVLQDDNITIRGAGMWHSILQGDYAAFFIKSNHVSFYDFALRGTVTSRRDAIDPSAIETDYDTPLMKDITIQNVWIDRYKTGIWTHNVDGMHIVGVRIRNTFADGINLRRGTSNTYVEQTDIRNTGDDALALWSSDYSDTNVKIRFNTIALPWLANNISLYGGTDIEVSDNVIRDTVGMGAGVNISTNFNPIPFGGVILVARNTFERCGSYDTNYNQENGAIWFNTVAGTKNQAEIKLVDNLIKDSTYHGISFNNKGEVSKVLIQGNTIDGCGISGIFISEDSRGKAIAMNNLITKVMLNEIDNRGINDFEVLLEITSVSALSNRVIENKKLFYMLGSALFVLVGGLLILLKLKKKR